MNGGRAINGRGNQNCGVCHWEVMRLHTAQVGVGASATVESKRSV